MSYLLHYKDAENQGNNLSIMLHFFIFFILNTLILLGAKL